MENEIYYVSSIEIGEIKEKLMEDKTLFVVEIDGSTIQNEEEFLVTMSSAYNFPRPITLQGAYFDVFNDWMRDLDWLGKNGYALIINNFNKFIKHDQVLKKEVIGLFEELILPFWEEEVIHTVVGGEVKPFNVYLVD